MATRGGLRNLGFQPIKLGVAAADNLQVAPLKGDELGPKSCQLQLGFGKLGLKPFEFSPLTLQFLLLRRAKLVQTRSLSGA